MRSAILVAAVVLAASSAVMVSADTYIYTWGSGGWNQEGRTDDDNPDSAIICRAGTCARLPNCSACHGQPVDQDRYLKDPENRHQMVYFPQATLRLGEGQRISLGSLMVRRLKGTLIVWDQKGPRFQLPPDAYVVQGKDGKPAFITYLGSKPPQPVR
ncbi:MAG: hypothetical protein IT480_01095 [Gammaproteobacteria bacterium]|nr:hypothetical protein [Gammaproteobacteria bacterium]